MISVSGTESERSVREEIIRYRRGVKGRLRERKDILLVERRVSRRTVAK